MPARPRRPALCLLAFSLGFAPCALHLALVADNCRYRCHHQTTIVENVEQKNTYKMYYVNYTAWITVEKSIHQDGNTSISAYFAVHYKQQLKRLMLA